MLQTICQVFSLPTGITSHFCAGSCNDEFSYAQATKLGKGGGDQSYDMIYLITAIGLPPGGSSTINIHTQTIHRMIQNKQYIEKHKNLEECESCSVLASYTLAFALQLRKKAWKNLSQSSRTIRIHRPNNKNTQITVLNRNTTIY